MASINDQLLDWSIAHRIGLSRYEAGTLREVLKFLNDLEKKILQRIQLSTPAILGKETLTQAQRHRLTSTLSAIREMNAEAHAALGQALRKSLVDLAKYEMQTQAGALAKFFPVEISLSRVPASLIAASVSNSPIQGRLLSQWVESLKRGQMRRIEAALRMGIASGDTLDDMVRRMRGERLTRVVNGKKRAIYRGGALSITKREAEAVVRTSVTHVSQMARESLFKANQDIMKGEMWVSTIDGRTTMICMSLDGKVFRFDEPHETPPAHVSCRSVMAPVLKSWEEMGMSIPEKPGVIGDRAASGLTATRAKEASAARNMLKSRMGGKEWAKLSEQQRRVLINKEIGKKMASVTGVAADKVTYNTFLRRQSASFQDAVLGRARGQIYRANPSMTLDRFLDSRLNTYSLQQLSKFDDLRVAELLKKLGIPI